MWEGIKMTKRNRRFLRKSRKRIPNATIVRRRCRRKKSNKRRNKRSKRSKRLKKPREKYENL